MPSPSRCDLTRDLQAKISRARDQLLVFLDYPGQVEPTNNGFERLLRPAIVQRKVTNGYRAMWAAEGEAAIRTVLDTARLTGAGRFVTILNTVPAQTPLARAWVVTPQRWRTADAHRPGHQARSPVGGAVERLRGTHCVLRLPARCGSHAVQAREGGEGQPEVVALQRGFWVGE
ncbi:Transposase IS66 family protein [Methylobacterium phyllosphaerae]|uniref:Transposase IS66 family protein n=1 Tax=Methylobacterium phyllosphaerae TaxID=418223 RepID=A0AAE8HQ04_9HYPH|nr:Transposase IS66 family protein [Methylobacterium phyllosphaerae]